MNTEHPCRFHSAAAPSGLRPPHYPGFTTTFRHTTLNVCSLDEWASQSQRPLPDNTQYSQGREIHIPGGIRTHTPVTEQPQDNALDRAATGNGQKMKLRPSIKCIPCILGYSHGYSLLRKFCTFFCIWEMIRNECACMLIKRLTKNAALHKETWIEANNVEVMVTGDLCELSIGGCVISGFPSPRPGASSGCGWRNILQYEG